MQLADAESQAKIERYRAELAGATAEELQTYDQRIANLNQ